MIEPSALTFVGTDVHRDTIAIALLRPGEHIPLEQRIANTPEAVRKQLRRWGDPRSLRVCYEAGPTGYELQRQLASLDVDCAVIAPSLIPKRPGQRVKTDKRDARKRCSLFRAGELTAVRIPGPEDEAVRDLIRAREDLTEDLLRARHRLSKFLLRHGRVYREGSTWTAKHITWIRAQGFTIERLERLVGHHLAILEVRLAQRALLDTEVSEIARSEPYADDVRRLACLRGISTLGALTLLIEVGDFQRFATAREFMGFTGLTASEYSSGERRRQGAITKTGNAHLRRILVEAAWSAQRRPSFGPTFHRRVAGQPPEVVRYAIQAQERLHQRYWRMVQRGKPSQVATVAVARELAGFVWGLMTDRTAPAAS
jgi:transposase